MIKPIKEYIGILNRVRVIKREDMMKFLPHIVMSNLIEILDYYYQREEEKNI